MFTRYNMRMLFVILILGICLCGCNNENKNNFSNFEHYDLSKKDAIYHTYADNNVMNKYAIADITPDSYEMSVYGLFYQVSDNDYVLLDKIESTAIMDDISKFYENKLYVIGMGDTPGNYEYTLNQEKITKKELVFDFSKGFLARSIKDVNKNEIYYKVLTNDEDTSSSISIVLRCSLSTYKCKTSE